MSVESGEKRAIFVLRNPTSKTRHTLNESKVGGASPEESHLIGCHAIAARALERLRGVGQPMGVACGEHARGEALVKCSCGGARSS